MDSNTDYFVAVRTSNSVRTATDYCIVECKDFVPVRHTADAGTEGKL